ncbi:MULTISPECIES: YigZ family protein [unclassified Lacticaseibacillus]|uniref:YigZ family protein n=1 Tax=unclassified Lacticaseibacillus TaxID=2759744 RepID=UPI001940915E|nr:MULTISPECIES: YigZ family protein [unclassified Lacticaseibacillus]
MTADYHTLTRAAEAEQVIKKSRFICAVAPIKSEKDAQAFITAVAKAHPKANHHVPVYLLGDDDHIQRANDAGEPAGTAGVPMLRTLQEMGLHDVVAVTTRYFGGIKLGAGGLIRAYAGSVTAAVKQAGISRRQMMRALTLSMPYAQLDRVTHWLGEQSLTITATDYREQVTVSVAVPAAQAELVSRDLVNLTAGQVVPELGTLSPRLIPMPQ